MQIEKLPNPSVKSPFNLSQTTTPISLAHVFWGSEKDFSGEYLFIAHFISVPNVIYEENINCRKAIDGFYEENRLEIYDHYFKMRPLKPESQSELDDIYFFLYDDLLIHFDTNNSLVKFFFRKTDVCKVNTIIQSLEKFKTQKKGRSKSEMFLLITEGFRLVTKPFLFPKSKLNINENYNDDFRETHELITKRLSQNNSKGLILLHGKPGTGKTSYIRYLSSIIKKKFLFVQPNARRELGDAEMLEIFQNHKNSVVVIEDAENILAKREKGELRFDSAVHHLLNFTDGLLSDALHIQIICSFNTDISNIDPALLRKGRLIAKYEFKELELEKAQRLSDKLGFKTKLLKPVPLTNIYNCQGKDYEEKKKMNPIGFVRQSEN